MLLPHNYAGSAVQRDYAEKPSGFSHNPFVNDIIAFEVTQMDYRTAAKEAGAGNVLPVYVCYGPEKYLMRQFMDYIGDKLIAPEHRDFAYSKYDLNETNVETVIEDAETFPFMVPKKIIVAHNALFFTGAKEASRAEHNLDKLAAYLKSPVDYSVIIFTVDADKLDERKTIVKSLKAMNGLIPFTQLGAEQLQDWVQRSAAKAGFSFAPGALEQFIMYVGGDLQRLASEIEKLGLYLGAGGQATGELIDQLVVRTIEQNVFLLIEEVAKLRIDRAFLILRELLEHKEEPIKIVMLIARQFRIMLQVKELANEGYTQGQIASQIGLHPYAVKLASGQAREFTSRQLTRILAALSDLDVQMKSGQIDKVLGLELFLLRLSGKAS